MMHTQLHSESVQNQTVYSLNTLSLSVRSAVKPIRLYMTRCFCPVHADVTVNSADNPPLVCFLGVLEFSGVRTIFWGPRTFWELMSFIWWAYASAFSKTEKRLMRVEPVRCVCQQPIKNIKHMTLWPTKFHFYPLCMKISGSLLILQNFFLVKLRILGIRDTPGTLSPRSCRFRGLTTYELTEFLWQNFAKSYFWLKWGRLKGDFSSFSSQKV